MGSGGQENDSFLLCPSGSATVSYASSYPLTNVTLTAPDGATLWSHQGSSGSVTFGVPSCGTYGLGV